MISPARFAISSSPSGVSRSSVRRRRLRSSFGGIRRSPSGRFNGSRINGFFCPKESRVHRMGARRVRTPQTARKPKALRSGIANRGRRQERKKETRGGRGRHETERAGTRSASRARAPGRASLLSLGLGLVLRFSSRALLARAPGMVRDNGDQADRLGM